jgi:hypothetical protein
MEQKLPIFYLSVTNTQLTPITMWKVRKELLNRFLTSPIDELVILHLKCLYAISQNDYLAAYNLQSTLTQTFTKILQAQKEENWSLPIMYVLCLDLRLLAQLSENQRVGVNQEKPGEILEKAAECLMGCFRVCAADNRSSEEDTKRIGMLSLVNQLLRCISHKQVTFV